MEALRTVELTGVKYVRGMQTHNLHLTYGLEHELFDQQAVDTAQNKYEASHRK